MDNRLMAWQRVFAYYRSAREQGRPCVGCQEPVTPGTDGFFYHVGVEVWRCPRCAVRLARLLEEVR